MTRKKRGSFILRAAVIVILVVSVVKLLQLDREIDAASAMLESYELDIDRQKREIALYNDALSKEDEDEFIERVARDEYGFAAPDEQIFIPIS